jgi:hypothetical protein
MKLKIITYMDVKGAVVPTPTGCRGRDSHWSADTRHVCSMTNGTKSDSEKQDYLFTIVLKSKVRR